MHIEDLILLREYSQIKVGDLFYAQGMHSTQRGLFPVTRVATRAGEFSYRYNGTVAGIVFGDQIKDVLLLRAGAEGKIEMFAGENVIKTLNDSSVKPQSQI